MVRVRVRGRVIRVRVRVRGVVVDLRRAGDAQPLPVECSGEAGDHDDGQGAQKGHLCRRRVAQCERLCAIAYAIAEPRHDGWYDQPPVEPWDERTEPVSKARLAL